MAWFKKEEKKQPPKKTSEDNTPEKLQQLCDKQRYSSIMLPDLGAIYEGCFFELCETSITIKVYSEVVTEPVRFGACCISYYQNNRSCVFISHVLEYNHDPAWDYPRLTIGLPNMVATTETRKAFRVPVIEDSGLELTLTTTDGQKSSPTAENISFGGLFVTYAQGDDPQLEVGSKIEAELRLLDHQVRVKSEIRSRREQSYGLFFFELVRDDDFDPPDSLRAIINVLERLWIQNKRKAGQN
ncbi:MAG: hypothetical protein GY854_19215 [Deltaproteobacteria bacterium]|nr:hypothetical protein [Deltaproteobacteria bacterium]